MSTDTLERPPGKPPRMGAWVAMAIETAIVVTFMAHGSLFGGLLCLAYGRFSATWAILTDNLADAD